VFWHARRDIARHLLCVSMVMTQPVFAAEGDKPTTDNFSPTVVNLTLNGVDHGAVLTLRDRNQVFYVSEVELLQWQVCHPTDRKIDYRGRPYFVLGMGIPQPLHYDPLRQTLEGNLPPDCYQSTRIKPRRTASTLTPTAPGAFFNYDFFASGSHGNNQREDVISGLFETVAFNRFGSVSTDAVVPSFTNANAADTTDSSTALVRLDTTFTHDDAEDMTRWNVGDAVGGSGIWGRPVRFAGIQFARNFASHPGFVTQPLPTVSGQAELPSTVEVYLNGILASRQQVQPGPFQIDDIPTVGAGGNVQLVVRDLLGRQVVTNLPFVTAAPLLRQGLTDFSLEAGTLRENYGIRSFDYDDGFISSTARYGVTDGLTVEGRTEFLPHQSTVGAGDSVVLPGIHYVLTSAVAGSHSTAGEGNQETIGLQPGSNSRIGVTASLQVNSARFVQLGTVDGQLPPRYTSALSLSWAFGRQFSVTLSQIRTAPRGQPTHTVDSLGLSHSFGHLGTLALSAFESIAGTRNLGTFLVYSLSLGGNSSLTSTANGTRDASGKWTTQVQSEFDRLPTSELGWGWDARATGAAPESSGDDDIGAGAVYQGADYSASAQVDGGVSSLRYQAELGGGLGELAGRVFASRKIYDSFGIARVPGLPGLPVYVENQLAGYTDAQGRALLPRLVEFTDNKISIDANDLPFDAELVGSDSITVAPYARSGVVVDLPVRRIRSALVVLVQANGTPIPVGARVSSSGAADAYVADRGEVYLRGVAPSNNTLRVAWESHRCEVRFDLPQPPRPQPRIGPLTCVEKQP
jgi:outer membrane usher protein